MQSKTQDSALSERGILTGGRNDDVYSTIHCYGNGLPGPFMVKAMIRSKTYLKVWLVVFGCLNTGTIHIELNKSYSMDALLLSITAFTSI